MAQIARSVCSGITTTTPLGRSTRHRGAGGATRTDDEARTLAKRRWYGREPTTEFEELLRAAISATDSGEPAE